MEAVATKSPYKRKLIDLTPTQFENLTFDLMTARGMKNVSWRTPGADGGRDIEGLIVTSDFSQAQTSERWFVECKRYKGSVDWPTIYTKIAYADSNKVDVLLMCTSAQFTPAAITQADNFNSSKRGIVVRLWPRHQMESVLQQHPDICMKYGLTDVPLTPAKSALQLALALSKSVGTHYSAVIFNDGDPDPMLESAHALALLLQRRMEDFEREKRFHPIYFDSKKFQIHRCDISPGFYKIDEPALSAFSSYLMALTREKIGITLDGDGVCKLSAVADLSGVVARYFEAFDAIAMWGDFEYRMESGSVIINQRVSGGV
ncbi:restriction endonuclease [Burkholderia gladioli]|uniref:restriction endonuclease n=1 Tax=Burkholderia gladioli TaxID=28095 RepID=UPI0016417860|nr:restriction endonuclease [Burkholderia gladioli]